MPNTYSQIYIHYVCAVKYRTSLILPEFEGELYKYIITTIKNIGQHPLGVNGMSDHVHIAARLRPAMAPSKFVQVVKANSSKWINDNDFLPVEFAWQKGGAIFSISHHSVNKLITYVKNQKNHHIKTSFQEEYINLLKSNGLDYDSRFLFDFTN